MKNEKALMCLLTASISALAAAPTLAAEMQTEDKNSLIDIEKFTSTTSLSETQLQQKKDLRAQIDILLSRKAPQMKIGESVDIMIDSYGKNSLSLKDNLFEKMGFGASTADDPKNFNYDSQSQVSKNTAGAAGSNIANAKRQNNVVDGVVASCDVKNVSGSDMTACPKGQYQFTACHTACHGVCHGACHGARGWR